MIMISPGNVNSPQGSPKGCLMREQLLPAYLVSKCVRQGLIRRLEAGEERGRKICFISTGVAIQSWHFRAWSAIRAFWYEMPGSFGRGLPIKRVSETDTSSSVDQLYLPR